ncbi:DUF3168 domain-containing protein [Roseibium sediminis]|uniref:DUF3168 domain-containing protein n=1 Tax=Roseibium sediminis TaxID=1775174 RepID=UPI00123D1145|nr:DUF3168 domain-containing protein [Roseibium sediminis]
MTASISASVSAQTSLRSGLFQCLEADGTLTGLLGGSRLFDGVPRAQAMPFLVLQDLESKPVLSDPEDGFVHDLTLSVYSRGESRDEAVAIAERACETLIHGPVQLSGHRLVNLTLGSVQSRRFRDGRGFQAAIRLRAVTEPVA